MKTQLFAVVFLWCFLSCNTDNKTPSGEEKLKEEHGMVFDKAKWRIQNDAAYAYRDKMLYDLIENRKLKPLKKEAILELLGEPDRTDSLYLFYTILQKRTLFFPLHTKSMVIKLKENDSVEWVKIHE